MATDFTQERNAFGGPLMPTPRGEDGAYPAAPYSVAAHAAGTISDDSARGVYDDMLRVADRDLAGDPNRLAARREEIATLAEAAGHPLPAPDPRSPAQIRYDSFWRATDTAQTGPGADGLPAAIQPAAVELWKKAPDDRPPSYMPASNDPGRTEALKLVGDWLNGAASLEKARELMALAERNTTVLRGLVAHAHAHKYYAAGRPR